MIICAIVIMIIICGIPRADNMVAVWFSPLSLFCPRKRLLTACPLPLYGNHYCHHIFDECPLPLYDIHHSHMIFIILIIYLGNVLFLYSIIPSHRWRCSSIAPQCSLHTRLFRKCKHNRVTPKLRATSYSIDHSSKILMGYP